MDGILTTVMNALEDAAVWVVQLLPSSPFRAITNSPIGEYMRYIGWVIPVAEITAIFVYWLSAIGVFYMYQAILRLVRMIE